MLDDPHKPEGAQSDLQRQAVIDWHDGTWSTRVNDERGVQVVVMQRLHEHDLTGHLLERGYTVLCLPAEYEPTHPNLWPRDPRRSAGDVLWPARFGNEFLQLKRRDLGGYGYAGQFQQRPAPAEGGILKRSWWRYFDPDGELPDFATVAQSWDFSFVGSERADYVVGQVWGAFGAKRYLLREVRGRMEFTEMVRAVERLTSWVVDELPVGAAHPKYIEDKANGPAVISTLSGKIGGIIAVRPEGDKTARVHAISPQLEAGNVLIAGAPRADGSSYDRARTPEWTQSVIDECAAFPNAAHDDQVDALSQALRKLEGAGRRYYRQRSRGRPLTGGMMTRQF